MIRTDQPTERPAMIVRMNIPGPHYGLVGRVVGNTGDLLFIVFTEDEGPITVRSYAVTPLSRG